MNNELLRLDRIEMENYRRFPRLDVDFHPELTVIVAKNGCGKTAVLDAVAVALGPYIGAFDEAKNVNFQASDVRRVRAPNLGPAEMESMYPLRMTAHGRIAGKPRTWSRELSGRRAHTTYGDARVLTDFGKSLQQRVREVAADGTVDFPTLPIISYYGTGRLWSEKRLTSGRKSTESTSRTTGYQDCLDSSSRYRIFADWFEKLCRMEYEERDSPDRLAKIQDMLDAIRSSVDAVLSVSGWGRIAFKSSELGIVVEHEAEGILPVLWMSDGIRNMIALAADIAHRAVRLNSHLGRNAARATPGIVLIDEVDMHLHPEWQQSVVQSFREAFPLIQLITTTHSPQVLTTVETAHIRVLSDDGHVIPLPQDIGTYGAESSRVLQEIFSVYNRPPTVESVPKLHEYLGMVEAEEHDTERGRQLRKELEKSFGQNDPDLLAADMRISQLKFLKNRPVKPAGEHVEE